LSLIVLLCRKKTYYKMK